MNKPWVGKTGFYVDDRAISPRQFLDMEIGELLNMARSEAFQYDSNSAQGWVIVRASTALDLDSDFIAAVQDNRAVGFRTLVLLDEHINGGHEQELLHNGCKMLANPGQGPTYYAGAVRHLLNEGLATSKSPIIAINLEHDIVAVRVPPIEVAEKLLETPGESVQFIGLAALSSAGEVSRAVGEEFNIFGSARPVKVEWNKPSNVLKSRHFNEVVAFGDRVYKTTTDPKQAAKLKLEFEWLRKVPGSVNVLPIPGGYASTMYQYGSLATVLARHEFDKSLIDKFADRINRLWKGLDALRDNDPAGPAEYDTEHMQLYVEKSIDRLKQLEEVWSPTTFKNWRVNGVDCGNPKKVVQEILAQLSVQTINTRGVFHGDFCPGNIVVDDMYSPKLALIDPRGTLDGVNLALHGDVRYDMGKLSHALRWGYDTILENWYDCDWTEDSEGINISLTLWDELEHLERPARLMLWDSLIEIGFGHIDGPSIESDEIQLIAALQLITCAPLHMDDPKRATALIARGLQAGVQTLERIKAKDT